MTDHAPPAVSCRGTTGLAGGAFPQQSPAASSSPGAPVSLSSAGAPSRPQFPANRIEAEASNPGLLAWVDGRKTYLLALVGALYVFGSDLGWWPCNDLVLALLGFSGLATLRHGVSKSAR